MPTSSSSTVPAIDRRRDIGRPKEGRENHFGLLLVEGVPLAKCAAEQSLLGVGAPGERWDDAGQHDQEGRPAAEGEGFAHGKQCEAEVDWVADEAIGAGCYEACFTTCLRHEAPCGTKLGPGSEDEGLARQHKNAP